MFSRSRSCYMALHFSSSEWPLTPRALRGNAGYTTSPLASMVLHRPAGHSFLRSTLELKVGSQGPKSGHSSMLEGLRVRIVVHTSKHDFHFIREQMDSIGAGLEASRHVQMNILCKIYANLNVIGGTPTETWALRACIIQGTQQLYVALLWYWGSSLTKLSTAGARTSSLVTSTRTVTAITTPIAVFMWALGLILFLGLPNYYHQSPGKVPSFYLALLRRKVVLVCFHISTPQGFGN
jgi:hypothetical protein